MSHESIKFTVKGTDMQRAKALVQSPTWKIGEGTLELPLLTYVLECYLFPVASQEEGGERTWGEVEHV